MPNGNGNGNGRLQRIGIAIGAAVAVATSAYSVSRFSPVATPPAVESPVERIDAELNRLVDRVSANAVAIAVNSNRLSQLESGEHIKMARETREALEALQHEIDGMRATIDQNTQRIDRWYEQARRSGR